MKQSEKIITLIRRYCLDLFRNGMSTQQNIAEGLLNGVEYLVGTKNENIYELKNELKQLGQESLKAKTISYGYSKPGHLKQIELERQKFIDFIDKIDLNNIIEVEPLPYRRRLAENEAKVVRQNLKKYWNFDGVYWEPLIKDISPKPFYFYSIENLVKSDYENLIKILSKITNDRIYEITEDRLDYEIDISEFDKDSFETIYSDKNNEWIIYISHEGTIAFGGLELMDEFDKSMTDKIDFKNKF